jgi:L-2-hydroxyglutarate oxidase LhgO
MVSPVETAQCDVAVIGAGVVGLAVARALAMAGREVLILEAADAIGTITSSRNSEVIHAGIYYPAGSLMAKFCVRGRRLLYEYCASHGVGHNKCGKLIVACDAAEPAKLADIAKRAAVNGVEDMRVLSAAEAIALEPALHCTGALLSPHTGIVDSHGLMLAYLGDAEDHGAMLALNAPVDRGMAREDGIELIVGGPAPMRLLCRTVVNSAGLDAPVIAGRIEGVRQEAIPKRYFAKGSYYALQGRNPFQRLIYPVPVPGGLGVHLTIDLAGQARFGPDVEWVKELNYDVDPRRADSFYAAVRRYWPALKDGALVPAYSGIRPKIVPPGAPGQDFILQDDNSHGVAGLINLLGIESPGLTSSLAIGEAVAAMAE